MAALQDEVCRRLGTPLWVGESDHAREYRTSRKNYRLARTPSGTHLDIFADMAEQYYDEMSAPGTGR